MLRSDLTVTGVSPDEWASRLSGPADLSSDGRAWKSALMRHWTNTSPDMDQPPLDHHYVVQHLGGAKSVERRHDGKPVSRIVETGSITIVPAGTQFKWHTRGPIEFSHLYVSPQQLHQTALRCERAGEWSLVDSVGVRDPLLEALYAAMLTELRGPGPAETLYLDSLLETLLLRLLLKHSTARIRLARARETLATHQLYRVKEYIETRLTHPIALADLARVAGGSVFHFTRAFKNTMGETPIGYVLRRRIDRARQLLAHGDAPIPEVAMACGFATRAAFDKTFRRIAGITAQRYRRC